MARQIGALRGRVEWAGMAPLWALLRALPRFRFDRLVLNGDIFDTLSTRRLTPEHKEVLAYLKALAREGVEVIWIEGNHDAGASRTLPGFRFSSTTRSRRRI